MTAISPELGARLANGVYSLTKREKLKDALTDLNLMFGDMRPDGLRRFLRFISRPADSPS